MFNVSIVDDLCSIVFLILQLFPGSWRFLDSNETCPMFCRNLGMSLRCSLQNFRMFLFLESSECCFYSNNRKTCEHFAIYWWKLSTRSFGLMPSFRCFELPNINNEELKRFIFQSRIFSFYGQLLCVLSSVDPLHEIDCTLIFSKPR